MRFSNEAYEKAFPRKEKEVKQVKKDQEYEMVDDVKDDVVEEPETKEVEPTNKEEVVNG